jgi:hypothetical protein
MGGKRKEFSQIVADKGADWRRFLVGSEFDWENLADGEGFDPADAARAGFARMVLNGVVAFDAAD